MSLYSFEGASGRHYDYALLNQKNRQAFAMSGGNYLFTRPAGSGLEIVCAGETESIWNVFVSTALWETAKKQYGATAAYTRVNLDQRERRIESWDLVQKHRPPMNADMLEEPAS